MKSFFDFDKKVTEYEMKNNLLPKPEPPKEPEKNTEMEPESTKAEPPTTPESTKAEPPTTPEPPAEPPTTPEPPAD